MILKTKEFLKDEISKILNKDIKFTVEIPSDRSHGDFATNAAMASCKVLKSSPKKVAEEIVLKLNLPDYFEKCEIANPGFINFKLKQSFYEKILEEILEKKDNYAKSNFGQNKKVMIEFVSANPTGPMHLGNARGGSLGDCLSSVLDMAGFDVTREFYINDAGNQIEKFATSLEARYLQLFFGEEEILFPKDGYYGDDIKSLALLFKKQNKDELLNTKTDIRKNALIDFALPRNINKMKEDLAKYRIEFDNWFYESSLYENLEVEETIAELKRNGVTYQKDGVLWIKADAVDCEKDKVLVRENGIPTYFAADIAYHRNKFLKRNFDICINIWGADHHGHVARMKGAMKVFGVGSERFEIILVQLVRLVRDKEVVKMSKRTGKAIGLVDLLEEVEVNEARFMFNMLKSNTQMDFDLDLASKQSSENPVYYVQYAHARICSILRKNEYLVKNINCKNFRLLNQELEKELIFNLGLCESEIVDAAKNYDPASVTRYVLKIASLFHKFYNSYRIEDDDENLKSARLGLCLATKIIINNILTMFKIDVPEVM